MSSVHLSNAVTGVTYNATTNILTLLKKSGNVNVALANTTPLATGTIVMFTGTSAPTGWSMCDGSNGTPNLTNCFIYGWGDEGVGTTGGATSYGTDTQGSHSHTVTVSATTLSTTTMPSHTHIPAGGYAGYPNAGTSHSGNYYYLTNWTGFPTIQYATSAAGSSGGHAHSASSDTQGAHSHTVSVVPPYYTLSYIMKL